jgi:hypothetical protein
MSTPVKAARDVLCSAEHRGSATSESTLASPLLNEATRFTRRTRPSTAKTNRIFGCAFAGSFVNDGAWRFTELGLTEREPVAYNDLCVHGYKKMPKHAKASLQLHDSG